ncbi:MAG: hypothetical protein Q9165_007736 [Trypethelium subeluteriae]
MPRPLVGLGHSMGGTSIINLATMHPRLLTSILLIDPIVNPCPSKDGRNLLPAYAVINKRDKWPSREAAESYHRRNKFFQSWDPRVLDLFLEFGIRKASSTGSPTNASSNSESVRLTTSKHQEALTHARAAYPPRDQPFTGTPPPRKTHPDIFRDRPLGPPFYRPEAALAFTQIPYLLPTVLYVTPTSSPVTTPDARAVCISTIGTGLGGNGGVKEGAVKEVTLPNSGHFVPFEKPTEVAQVLGAWLDERLAVWREDEEEERRAWGKVKAEDKSKVDEDWMFWMEQLAGKRGQKERSKAIPQSKL